MSKKELTAQELEQRQNKHTRWLEENERNTLKLHGVPIFKMFNYEIQQHMNGIYLSERLSDA